VSIVNIEAADPNSGYSTIWNDTGGTVNVAFFGYAPLTLDGELLKITVQLARGGTTASLKLTQAEANEGNILTTISSFPPVRRTPGTGPTGTAGTPPAQPVPGSGPKKVQGSAPTPAAFGGGTTNRQTTKGSGQEQDASPVPGGAGAWFVIGDAQSPATAGRPTENPADVQPPAINDKPTENPAEVLPPTINDKPTENPTDVLPPAAADKPTEKPKCADVTYHVTAQNTSGAELSLTELADDGLGSLTAVHDGVVGTTCGVPQTLSKDGTYECDVTAHVCGEGHANRITGTASGPDGGKPARASEALKLTLSSTDQP
jgi:hypothetical protein